VHLDAGVLGSFFFILTFVSSSISQATFTHRLASDHGCLTIVQIET
jgi:hypothetical protein